MFTLLFFSPGQLMRKHLLCAGSWQGACTDKKYSCIFNRSSKFILLCRCRYYSVTQCCYRRL